MPHQPWPPNFLAQGLYWDSILVRQLNTGRCKCTLLFICSNFRKMFWICYVCQLCCKDIWSCIGRLAFEILPCPLAFCLYFIVRPKQICNSFSHVSFFSNSTYVWASNLCEPWDDWCNAPQTWWVFQCILL